MQYVVVCKLIVFGGDGKEKRGPLTESSVGQSAREERGGKGRTTAANVSTKLRPIRPGPQVARNSVTRNMIPSPRNHLESGMEKKRPGLSSGF